MAPSRPSAPPVVLEGLRKSLGAGWAPGLTLLTGEDSYHLDAAQRALLEALVPGEESDFALTVYGEQKVDLNTVVGAARSVGMFAPRRVVLVREVGALDGDPEGLKAYASRPPENSYLLVRAPKLDLRRKLHQALAKSGTTLIFDPAGFDAARLTAEIGRLARDKGLKLAREATAFLAEACSADFYRVDAELEKIRCWLGDEATTRTVTIELVRDIAAGSAMLSGWEVANAILERDGRTALARLRELLDAGNEPLQLLGGIAFRARSMLQAAVLLKRRVPLPRVKTTARLWAVRDEAITRGLGRYGIDELLRFPSLLLEADRTLKSRGVAPAAVLESLVSKMTETVGEGRP